MWSAIRSDLKEFVSTVKDDSAEVLENIESNLIEDNLRTSQCGISSDTTNTENVTAEDVDGLDLSPMTAPTLAVGVDDVYIGSSMGYEETGIISDASDEAIRRSCLIETYTTPLLQSEVNGNKTGVNTTIMAIDQNDTSAGTGTDEGESRDTTTAKDDSVHETNDESNNGSELIDDEVHIKEFIATFDISSKTDEISNILTKNKDTVNRHFEDLVPVTITYEQFWQRYYFRCDPLRIQGEWDEDTKRLQKERKEMLDKGVKSVQTIFGGALKAIQGVTTASNDKKSSSSIYEKYQAELELQQRAMMDPKNSTDAATDKKERGVGLGLFGNGRPPFVMNTAVSEDEDESFNQDEQDDGEEEEADEFGWGSEEDSEDEDVKSDDELDSTQEMDEDVILFSDPNVEKIKKLNEELSLAIEERDQLQSTVEMQKQEIERLQHSDQRKHDVIEYDEIERLKMIVFEKDSELAALKASLDDPDQHIDAADKKQNIQFIEIEREVKELRAQLSLKEDELQTVQLDVSTKTSEVNNLSETNEKNIMELNEAKETISQLQTILSEMKELNSVNEKEKQHLQEQQSDIQKKSEEKHQRILLDTQKTIEILESELKDANEMKDKALERADNLQRNMEHASKVSGEDMTPGSSTSSSPSPLESSSISSGVKVNVDSIPKTPSDQDDEDDWGDAW